MSALLPLEQALQQLLQVASQTPLTAAEWVPLVAADNRVLAKPLRAPIDLPLLDYSAMDGYALRLADGARGPLPVSQRIFAGSAPAPLAPDSCARIFTGALIPEGADAVELQENSRLEADERVGFPQPLRPGQNIRRRGEEVAKGESILAAGTRLGPVELGLAASLGVAELEVLQRPKVALFASGDELVPPGQPLGLGQIYNSNLSLLVAMLQRLGCEVIDGGTLADDGQATQAALDGLGPVDLILTSGGVSVGEADVLGQLLQKAGELLFWKVNIKPGKPFLCGRYGQTPVLGLPGNPGAVLVTFGLLVRPYLLARMGVACAKAPGYSVVSGFDWPRAGKRREFVRVRIEQGRALLNPRQGSGGLRGAAEADGLAEILENTCPRQGDALRFIPFAELLG